MIERGSILECVDTNWHLPLLPDAIAPRVGDKCVVKNVKTRFAKNPHGVGLAFFMFQAGSVKIDGELIDGTFCACHFKEVKQMESKKLFEIAPVEA